MTAPVRLPDAASLEAVLTGLDPACADADLVPALARAFPGFEFRIARIEDDYWLGRVFLMTPATGRPRFGQAIAAGRRDSAPGCPIATPACCCAGRTSLTAFDGAPPMDDITSGALVSDPETRRALQLDTLSAILPMERRDRLAELLTDDDVATLSISRRRAWARTRCGRWRPTWLISRLGPRPRPARRCRGRPRRVWR